MSQPKKMKYTPSPTELFSCGRNVFNNDTKEEYNSEPKQCKLRQFLISELPKENV